MTERFSASVAARHMACPASANLDLAIYGWQPPVEDRTADNAANRGTNMHEVFAKVMDMSGAELRDITKAITYVAELRQTRRFKQMVEQTVTADWLVSQPYTTADLVLYTQDELHILDLKWGTIEVEVIDNAQLMFGAISYAHLAPKAKGAWLHILQPRAGGCTKWWASATDLARFKDAAVAAEAKTLAGDTTFGPSDECKFCPAFPHSRGAKGNLMCPATMQILYPAPFHEDEILSL